MDKFEVLCHSSIRIEGSKIIYFDPFNVKENYNDADYIFCTHSHYDHFSPDDIRKVMKPTTYIITVESARPESLKLVDEKHLFIVEPNIKYEIAGIQVTTTRAYNIAKLFHPKINNWVGFVVELDGNKYYISGDTDNIPEIRDVDCDVAFLPVGGKFTMNYKEAAKLANGINAKVLVPTHYGEIVGGNDLGQKFSELVEGKKVKVFIS